jgi:hypothetical protein
VSLQADFGLQVSALRAELGKERDRRAAVEAAVGRLEAELNRERERRMELEAEVGILLTVILNTEYRDM